MSVSPSILSIYPSALDVFHTQPSPASRLVYFDFLVFNSLHPFPSTLPSSPQPLPPRPLQRPATMGPPETAAQCLCPLDGDSHGSSGSSDSPPNAVFVSTRRQATSEPDKRAWEAEARVVDRIRHSSSSIPSSLSFPLSSPLPSPHFPSSSLRLRPRLSSSFYDGGDAQQCIAACRRGFLHKLAEPSPQNAAGSSLADACALLSYATAQHELWQLYWCDSAFCGVWIEADGGTGQDRE